MITLGNLRHLLWPLQALVAFSSVHSIKAVPPLVVMRNSLRFDIRCVESISTKYEQDWHCHIDASLHRKVFGRIPVPRKSICTLPLPPAAFHDDDRATKLAKLGTPKLVRTIKQWRYLKQKLTQDTTLQITKPKSKVQEQVSTTTTGGPQATTRRKYNLKYVVQTTSITTKHTWSNREAEDLFHVNESPSDQLCRLLKTEIVSQWLSKPKKKTGGRGNHDIKIHQNVSSQLLEKEEEKETISARQQEVTGWNVDGELLIESLEEVKENDDNMALPSQEVPEVVLGGASIEDEMVEL